MYVCAGGGRGWQTYPKSWPKKTRKKTHLVPCRSSWGGVAIAKTSNLNVNFLKKKKKVPVMHFYNHALKKVGPGLKRGGGGSIKKYLLWGPPPLPWCYDAKYIWFVFCCIFYCLFVIFLLTKFSAYFGYYRTLAIHDLDILLSMSLTNYEELVFRSLLL